MNDCTNVEARDSLPDLLNNRLAGDTRARVQSHVESCPDCTAEMDLLRAICATSLKVPAVDVAGIAAVLPDASQPRSRNIVRNWSLAAAAAVIVAVAGVAGFMSRDASVNGTINQSANVLVNTRINEIAPPSVKQAVNDVPSQKGLALVGGLNDVSSDSLRILIAQLDSIHVTPANEPEEVVPNFL